jgi:hypothetical protein
MGIRMGKRTRAPELASDGTVRATPEAAMTAGWHPPPFELKTFRKHAYVFWRMGPRGGGWYAWTSKHPRSFYQNIVSVADTEQDLLEDLAFIDDTEASGVELDP